MTGIEPDAIARVAYEARRVYARSLGDDRVPAWDEATPQQRQEALAGVEAVLCGAASTGERLHALWSQRTRRLDLPGDLFKVDYRDLPIAERRKLLLFRATVLALIDGPCTGLCHDEKCRIIEDHACHLDTCLSRFGIPPGAWAPADPSGTGAGKLYS
jgi:hypothetical protein